MIADVAVGLIVGIAVGLVFFGGLQFTMLRLAAVKHPLVLVVFSFFARIAVVAGALVAVAGGRAVRVVAALIGILAARTVLVSRARRELGTTEESSWR